VVAEKGFSGRRQFCVNESQGLIGGPGLRTKIVVGVRNVDEWGQMQRYSKLSS
jgi:hypothetical protein